MNRAVRTTTPLRVTSLTSTTPRRVTTSTRRPDRVATTSYVLVLPPPASMTISTRSPFIAAARRPGGPHYDRCATYLSSAPRAPPANLRFGGDPPPSRPRPRRAPALRQCRATAPRPRCGPGTAEAQLPALAGLEQGARGPAGVAVLDGQRHAEALGQVHLGEPTLQPPGREHRATAHEHRVGEPGRHLFDVVGHHHHGGRGPVGGEPRDPAHQVLPAAEVQARRGLIEEQQFRVGHQRAGDLDPLALPLGQRPEPAADQVRAAERVQQFYRPGDVGGVIVLLPPPDDRVGG